MPFRSLAVQVWAAGVCAVAITSCNGNPGGPQTPEIRVNAISPSSGSTFGGTTVTITGSGFAQGAKVDFGGTAATNVTVISDKALNATTPAHVAGSADVRVTVGTKSGSLAGAFVFAVPIVGPNLPPTVSALTVQPPRTNQPTTLASVGDRISLTASVNDAETPANQLIYEWAASPNLGAFIGSGPAVQWAAPLAVSSPQLVLLTLTVIERYTVPDTQGLPVQREHRIQQGSVLRVHDSVSEISALAVDFLTQFSISSVPHERVLQNFSRTCDDGEGYAEELDDVLKHRRDYVMLSYQIGTPAVTFAYGSGESTACPGFDAPGDACARVPVVWTDRRNDTGAVNTVTGRDVISAVYENSRWLLCHSRWDPDTTNKFHPFFSRIK